MRLKPGVRIRGLKAELVLGLQILEKVFDRVKTDPYQEFVVTSCTDGVHMPGSFHYEGLAADLRSSTLTAAQRTEFLLQGRAALGLDFDLILEKDHFHLEFDPD